MAVYTAPRADVTSHSDGRAVLARDRVAASRALALFSAAGGIWLLAIGATIPGFAGHGAALVASLAVGAALVLSSIDLWFHAPRVSGRVLATAPVLAVLIIGVLNLVTRDASTGSQLFLLWPMLFAASFLSRRRTLVVGIGVLVAEAVVMGVLEPAGRAVVDTLALAVVYSVAAIAVLTFRARVELLLVALSAQAREDALTGLPNRRAFDDQLAQLAALSERSGESLSLLAVDVDWFKDVNDTRGHAAGDQVLRSVADALRRSGREADLVARVGGDEFAMILPRCTFADALAVSMKVREHVSVHTARLGAAVTVSVGAATMPEMAATPEQLLVVADAALYAAKVEGREHGRPAGAPYQRGDSPS